MTVEYVRDSGAEREIAGRTHDLLGRLAEAVARDARRMAPVDTGALREGIHAEEPVGNTVRVTSSRDVADEDGNVPLYVEYGTEKMAAQPYMRPALFRKRPL